MHIIYLLTYIVDDGVISIYATWKHLVSLPTIIIL